MIAPDPEHARAPGPTARVARVMRSIVEFWFSVAALP